MTRADQNPLRLATAIAIGLFFSLQAVQDLQAAENAGHNGGPLRIGWAETEITPPRPVILTGLGHARVSEGVKDPLTATALVIESTRDGNLVRVVMVSCDLLSISDDIRDAVRTRLSRELAELDPNTVFIGATHTHTAPFHYIRPRYREQAGTWEQPYGLALPVMSGQEYVDFASVRIAKTVITAWNERKPAGIAYGLGHAVVGRNRLTAYSDGTSKMYGKTGADDFSHVEGYEDHSVNIMATFRSDGELSGLIVNIASPAQSEESGWQVSADFWHETRQELRRRYGKELFVLPQCSAAGDQSARPLVDRRAEQRMWRLASHSQRQEIAVRIADAVDRTVPLIHPEIDWNPICSHRVESVELPRRMVSEESVQIALRESEQLKRRYQKLLGELDQHPETRQKKRWYQDVTRAYRPTLTGKKIESRFIEQQGNPNLSVELHAVRLGDIGFVTNPFELYLDYAMQIKGRSPATQTFVVQLVGPGSYLPTARSIEGGAYGAKPSNNEVTTKGGKALVDWSLETLQDFWKTP